MLVKYIFLLYVPTVVYSHIKINIKPNQDGTEAKVDLLGDEKADVSNKDREVFKIDDHTLKRASQIFMGARCNDVYIRPPTPWGDVFAEYGWSTVKKTVEPVEAKVIGFNSRPVAFGASEYVNNHESLSITFSTSVTHEVEETVTHTWSKGGEVGGGFEINYSVNFGIGSVGGARSLSYSSSWGEETSKGRAVTLGTTSSVLAEVPPKSKVIASILATEGTMEIEIKYKTTLDGKVFCNYPNRYKGHYFYAMPIRSLLKSVDSPLEVYSTEKISIGFYTSARIEVSKGILIE